MADIVSKEKRHENMAAIRSKDTAPEVYLRKLLFPEDTDIERMIPELQDTRTFTCRSTKWQFL